MYFLKQTKLMAGNRQPFLPAACIFKYKLLFVNLLLKFCYLPRSI
ncbi:MAG: hypothetical protein AVDCRST_MAG95-368 [uncultured Adhaeribacter sp.]|uniref:Uncharacterized protein n=1 Tax=uncultured Adhaeribacter sp. TaxID=448109 RepID=A0A6J4H984_9BACT|nr:MAG: hypothetical protein AVDCRST_MAG95-368 [uncultured Adhaeribacter sp.]